MIKLVEIGKGRYCKQLVCNGHIKCIMNITQIFRLILKNIPRICNCVGIGIPISFT